jgi:hypothetical protein
VTTDTSPAELAARVLRPRRAALADALAAVTDAPLERWRSWLCYPGQRDGRELRVDERAGWIGWPARHSSRALLGQITADSPDEAWERLVPASWVQDPARGFQAPCPYCDGQGYVEEEIGTHYQGDPESGPEPEYGTRDCGCMQGYVVQPHPPTVAACVAFASDPQGIATAEALAREVAARLRPWLGTVAEHVVWRVAERYTPAHTPCTGWPVPLLLSDRVVSGDDSLYHAGYALGRAIAAWAGHADKGPIAHVHGYTTAGAAVWDANPERHPGANPFAALRDLQRTGYWLDAITPEHLVLVAPALDGAP